MRIFVGLDIPPEIRQRITTFLDSMRHHAPDAKWVSPESLHVTLKFIGEQPRERVDEIHRALATVQEAPFEVTFRKTGFFPPARPARVFWIGVEAGERLRELALKVDETVSRFGIEREKDYTPHLTLARVRPESRRKDRRSKGPGTKAPSASSNGEGGDDRPASKHRPASGPQFAELQSQLGKAPEPEFGTMAAREFFLYESRLSPKGAQYTKIAKFALG
jgi:2'-5' RNA ligase